jgi:hypothetical protein
MGQLQTYADLSGLAKQDGVKKPPKTFFTKFTKALEKKFLKTLVSLPAFGLGFFANTASFKHFINTIF